MTTICIGPLCIPLQAALPFFFILFRMALRWFMKNVLGIKDPDEKAAESLPPAPAAVAARTWKDAAIAHVESMAHLEQLKAKAKAAGVGFVLDFTAVWCGPCRMIAPHFEALRCVRVRGDGTAILTKTALGHQTHSHCTHTDPPTHSKDYNACFAKVDVDEADDVASHFGVRSMPTFVFLGPDGAELVRFSGCNKAKLEELVARTCARVGSGSGEGNGKKED